MSNEPQLSFEQPRSAFGTWLGVVLLFAVFALVVWVIFNLMPRGDSYEAKRAEARVEKLKVASQEWNTALHTYGWVDKEKGVARIPIERAMELTVAEMAQRKPAPAGPIATPVAAPAAAPAGASPAEAVPSTSLQPSPASSPNASAPQSAGDANAPNTPPTTPPAASASPVTSPAPLNVSSPAPSPAATPSK